MEKFDFDIALKQLQSGKGLTGKDGILTPLIKQLTEAALKAELEVHLEHAVAPNRKNGSTSKTIKTSSGNFELDTPRDRVGSFEPQLVKKHQTCLSDEIESKILSMYALGMSYDNIASHIADMYCLSISTAAISAIQIATVANKDVNVNTAHRRALPGSVCSLHTQGTRLRI
jgi:putative transposase